VPEGKPWHGLWRFPDFDAARMSFAPRTEELGASGMRRGTRGETIAMIKYGITKYSVTMEAVSAKWKVAVDLRATEVQPVGRYLTTEEMQALAFAAPHRKLAKTLTKSDLPS